MKLCYIVYREENVLVYESQVLEYLQSLKQKHLFDTIELIVFRHEKNLNKREEVETRILNYLDDCYSIWTLPIVSLSQLKINAARLKSHLRKKYDKDESIAVICRGDPATFIGVRAFAHFQNSRILFDNRGLAFEESVMSYHNKLVHILNRNAKLKAMRYSKDRVDMYNFVTHAMRNYFLEHYNYNPSVPYTIIPTLFRTENLDEGLLDEIKKRESVSNDDIVVSYVGSTAAWQSTNELASIIGKIGTKNPHIRFFVLSNGRIQALDDLPSNIRDRITVKSIPHSEMKYYLEISNIGIVIRDSNIVNKVAAPTKIAEYLMCGNSILYKGDIGIIEDLRSICGEGQLVCLDEESNWIEKVFQNRVIKKTVNERVLNYFDMDKRQYETVNMIQESFSKPKREK